MPSVYFFSYTLSAHEGTAYKARDTVSKQLLTWSRTRSTLPAMRNRFSLSDTPSLRCCWLQVKKAVIILECATAFLVLGHFYAVPLVVSFNKVRALRLGAE